MLLLLVRHPFVLWQSYEATGIGHLWGSFPPLLPPLFGALVWPWTRVAPDFWALRLGSLAWAVVVLLGVHAVLARGDRVPDGAARAALWTFALVPSAWASCALQPQEELFAGGFALALYAAARAGRFDLVPWILVATGLAAKYFLLVLLVPVAFASPRPWRNAIAWGALAGGALAAYVGYHWLAHGVTPILDYELKPFNGLSLWALAWQLGWEVPQRIAHSTGVLVTGIAALAIASASRRRGVPLVFAMAAVLYVALIAISITFPTYELWALPLVAVALAHMRRGAPRIALVALLCVWAAGSWGLNFARGVARALSGDFGAGKTAFAARIEGLLGAGFPYGALHLACLVTVLLAGAAIVALLWRAGCDAARAPGATAA